MYMALVRRKLSTLRIRQSISGYHITDIHQGGKHGYCVVSFIHLFIAAIIG